MYLRDHLHWRFRHNFRHCPPPPAARRPPPPPLPCPPCLPWTNAIQIEKILLVLDPFGAVLRGRGKLTYTLSANANVLSAFPPAGNTKNRNLAGKQQISGKRSSYFTLTPVLPKLAIGQGRLGRIIDFFSQKRHQCKHHFNEVYFDTCNTIKQVYS
jgi:hypothetical protein